MAPRKAMTMEETITRMLALSETGYSCAQILMTLALEQESRQNTGLVRAMAGLGEGCGFFDETCGVITGASCVLAWHSAKGSDTETESPNFLPMLQDLHEWFGQTVKAKCSGTRCVDIVGDEVGTEQGRQICGALLFETHAKINEIATGYLSS